MTHSEPTTSSENIPEPPWDMKVLEVENCGVQGKVISLLSCGAVPYS